MVEHDSRVAALPLPVVGRPAKRQPAVKWLSVVQLVRTALEVRRVTRYAKLSDRRAEFAHNPREFYRLAAGSEVLVDFVADTGDGFDATFATAQCVAGAVEVPGEERRGHADLLVLGGDLVYPVASAERYEARLNSVFRAAAALGGVSGQPPVVALPGNHDWYDGLVSFSRNFCGSWPQRTGAPAVQPVPADRDDVGGWGAFQSRSYFAVQLTDDWWLWGIDSQLDAPIDDEQLSYFHQAKALLGDAGVILCTATPSWLDAAGTAAHRAEVDTPLHVLLTFVDEVLGESRDQLRLVVTGDKHHYARYESPTGPPLVTCGGGGAFLSATHHLPTDLHPVWRPWAEDSGSARYTLATAYPTREQSRKLVAPPRFLAAGWRNGPSLPLLAGLVGLALFLALHSGPAAGGIAAGLLAVGLWFYAGYGEALAPARILLALAHTAGHTGVAALAFLVPLDPLWAVALAAFPALAVLNTAVFVTYLHVADRWGWHTLEAFSGMRFDGYKCHLRMTIGATGIEVTVIGMDDITTPPTPRVVEKFEVTPKRPAT